MNHTDTIVAPITAVGGAVAWLRLSGPDAFEVASSVFDRMPTEPTSHHAAFGLFVTGDEGIALPFTNGHGYTGQPSVELSIHGSKASVDALLSACIRSGARLAQPGEFTLRAFLNGRLDLAQAEAVRDTVAAQTEAQLRYANAQRHGLVTARVRHIVDQAMATLAAVEAAVDFSEEIGEFDSEAGLRAIEAIRLDLEALLRSADAGRYVRKGVRIALVGPPNAGKSSLFNRLLASDRSIVTDVPGTTRDTIEETVTLGGVPCVVIDTAGLRETNDEVERLGVERSSEAAENADFVWYVHDATLPIPSEVPKFDLLVLNKCDLIESTSVDVLRVSAKTGSGLDRLDSWVADRTGLMNFDVVIDPRHAPHIEAALSSVVAAKKTVANDLPSDLLSVHLRSIVVALGQITGETASADMIERIFQDFCIGK